MLQLSETYRRGLAERKAWLAEHPNATWADAVEAWNAKRLAETTQQPTAQQTPIQETAPAVPADEAPAPLHTLSSSEFGSRAVEYWDSAFERLGASRPAAGSPFFTGWNSPIAPSTPSAN